MGYLQLIVNDSCRDELEMRHYVEIAFNKSLRLKKLIEEYVPILDEAGMKYRVSIPTAKVKSYIKCNKVRSSREIY